MGGISYEQSFNALYESNWKYCNVTKKFDTDSIDVKEILNYDAILIGVYTISAGDVPIHVEDFFDELYDLDFKEGGDLKQFNI